MNRNVSAFANNLFFAIRSSTMLLGPKPVVTVLLLLLAARSTTAKKAEKSTGDVASNLSVGSVACNAVGAVVNIIKINQVTDFCVSLLHYTTDTITQTIPAKSTVTSVAAGITTTTTQYTSTK